MGLQGFKKLLSVSDCCLNCSGNLTVARMEEDLAEKKITYFIQRVKYFIQIHWRVTKSSLPKILLKQ